VRVVLSGGGTGGHVYPALEVGRYGREQGAELRYFGSEIGMERDVATRVGVPYVAYPSQALYRRLNLQAAKTLIGFVRSIQIAKRELRGQTDVVFATGGYGAAPTMYAARSLGIPYVIHDSNSVPGRTNRMFARKAAAFTAAFRKTAENSELGAIRTGQPIREELRAAVSGRNPERLILVLGGSQGSVFLNQLAIETADKVSESIKFLIAAGRKNADALRQQVVPANVQIEPFLDADHLARAYQSASLILGRSGGTLAEIAMFGIPSILVPLPSSADDHQFYNAKEFANMEAATVLWPENSPGHSELRHTSATEVAAAIDEWVGDPTRIANASHNLKDWDIPDATRRIWSQIQSAAK
jgi:UDP-N-acetylglucosamine--N-acetylmuramyl-(pentapeptide) pyrophosphoryl-undecaprenol N-acetylglucosamine transferase